MRRRALCTKELAHIRRDPRSLMIVLAMPVLMLVMYGYALNMDVKHITLCVLDRDHSADSRQLVAAFTAGGFFTLRGEVRDRDEAAAWLWARRARVALVIPQGFARDRARGDGGTVQLLVDGSDATTANVAVNDAELLVAGFSAAGRPGRAPSLTALPVQAVPRVWYNPDLQSSNFLVPGLMATLLMMISALLTSITIAREKETGTLEQMLVSPVTAGEIVIGKVLPYVLIAFADGVLVLVTGRFLFGVHIHGSVAQLLAFSVLYVTTALSIGLLISTLVSTQQQAMLAAQLATTLPAFILSGYIFPLDAMPLPLRVLSHIVPARYYLIIIRGIILKGTSWEVFVPEAVSLVALTVVVLALTTVRFRAQVRG